MTADQLSTFQLLAFIYSLIFIISIVLIAFQLSMIKQTQMEIVEEQKKHTEIFKYFVKLYEKSSQ